MIKWPNLGLYGDFEVCEAGVLDAINKNFFLLDILVQMGALEFIEDLPLVPVRGDIYILNDDNTIQAFDGEEWIEIVPNPGTIVYVIDEDEFYWYDGTDWIVLPKNFGDVVAPASSTDNAIARFDGATGKLLKDSIVFISDTGSVTGSTNVDTGIVNATTGNITNVIASDVTTTLIKTDLLGISTSIENTLTGIVTLPAPTTLVTKIQSAITQVDNITAPTSTKSRLHIYVNEKVSTEIIFSESGNIKTGTGDSLVLKPNASVWVLYDKGLNIWRVVGGSGSGTSSSSDSKNLVPNGDAESGAPLDMYFETIIYDYPINLGIGNPTGEFSSTLETVAPLNGKKSFKLTSLKTTTNAAGAKRDFKVPISNRGKKIKISIQSLFYPVNAANPYPAGENTFGVFIADLDAGAGVGALIPLDNILLKPAKSTSVTNKFEATFTASAASTNYRLMIHCREDLANAFVLTLDDINISLVDMPAPVDTEITALNIDWSLGDTFYKLIAANSTFTFSNVRNGKTVSVFLKNTSGANITVTLPAVLASGALNVTIKPANENVYTFIRSNNKTYAALLPDMV